MNLFSGNAQNLSTGVRKALAQLESVIHKSLSNPNRSHQRPFSSLSWYHEDLTNFNAEDDQQQKSKQLVLAEKVPKSKDVRRHSLRSRSTSLVSSSVDRRFSREGILTSGGSNACNLEDDPVAQSQNETELAPHLLPTKNDNTTTDGANDRDNKNVEKEGSQPVKDPQFNHCDIGLQTHIESDLNIQTDHLENESNQTENNLAKTPLNSARSVSAKSVSQSADHPSVEKVKTWIGPSEFQSELPQTQTKHQNLKTTAYASFKNKLLNSRRSHTPNSFHSESWRRSSVNSHQMASFSSKQSTRPLSRGSNTSSFHRAKCILPEPQDSDKSDSMSMLSGPQVDIMSLHHPPACPRPPSGILHHHSGWYHVPGRYPTSEKPYPPKRSQNRIIFVMKSKRQKEAVEKNKTTNRTTASNNNTTIQSLNTC